MQTVALILHDKSMRSPLKGAFFRRMPMESIPVASVVTVPKVRGDRAQKAPGSDEGFRSPFLERAAALRGEASSPVDPSLPPGSPPDRLASQTPAASPSARHAAGAYVRQSAVDAVAGPMSDAAKYKDDQLLSNPGGDHYDLENHRFRAEPSEQKSFWGRIGKDIKDALGNVKNFFGNLLFGSKTHYRDANGQVREAEQRGLVGSVVDFFQDLGSALSFGAWRPDGEEEPEGLAGRVGFFFSKLKEAVFGDLVQGVTGSVVHMAEDLLFAGWNLVEVVPDATIGNVEAGRKATTAVFDNGQVFLDYVTDVLPGGEASVRVHSWDLKNGEVPFLHNIRRAERETDDVRWKYVRNTPFRKAIETVGSILFDIVTLNFFGHLRGVGEDRKHPE